MDFLLYHTPILYLIQSFWRDEAFSVLLALRPVSEVFKLTFEPPLYYLLLHYWIKIFGTGEIAVRSLSLLGFSLTVYTVVIWSEKLFKKHWLSWYFPIFFFFNPMLLYYAFEARAYAWYMFFIMSSLYFYSEKKWKSFILVTTLGLYTHTYMVFVPFIELLHYIFEHRHALKIIKIKNIIYDPLLRSLLTILLIYSPWIFKLCIDLPRLKQSWYFPIDFQLVISVLTNIFIGYEGTPYFLWQITSKVSYVLLGFFLYSLYTKHRRSRNSLFFLLLFLPLSIIIGVSYFKPLFVNRYMIFCTIAEIFLIIFAIENIRNTVIQKVTAGFALFAVILFLLWYPTYNRKPDIRKSIREITSLAGKNDVVMVDNALLLFEAMYYSPNIKHVYWYNPDSNSFPWYIGDAIYSTTQSVDSIPSYPNRAFIIHLGGTYEILYSSQISSNGKSVNQKK